MHVRRMGMLAAALVAAAAVLVPAGAAHAAESGAGWSGSWDYYVNDSYRFTATLPGVRLLGFSSDTGGTRFAGVSLEDTEADARCAQVQMYGQRDGGLALLADRTVCDGEAAESFGTGSFSGDHQIYIGRLDPGTGFQDKNFSLIVPGSGGDPELREAGTGTSWEYYTDQAFKFTVVRPGVTVTGFGTRQGPETRSVFASVQHTGPPDTCAYGEATDFINVVSAMPCAGGDAPFSSNELTFDILVQGCHVAQSWRCVSAFIPEPF